MGHPADHIPPSLGAPAVRSHCVRMDGGMGGIKVKTQTKPRPCAKFPTASKNFYTLGPAWCLGRAQKGRNHAVVQLCAHFVGRLWFVPTFDVHDARDFWLGKRLLEKLDG